MKCFLRIHLDVWEKKSYQWKPKGQKQCLRYVFLKGSDDMGWFSACLEILPLSFYHFVLHAVHKALYDPEKSWLEDTHFIVEPGIFHRYLEPKISVEFWSKSIVSSQMFFLQKSASSFEGWGCLGWSLHYPNHPNPNTDSIKAPSRHWPLTRPHLREVLGL